MAIAMVAFGLLLATRSSASAQGSKRLAGRLKALGKKDARLLSCHAKAAREG